MDQVGGAKMKDRIKFRVFISDKKNSKNSLTGMFKVHSLHTGTNKAIITSLYGNCSIKLENNILMQCTGLKDKNGKLIYEGDILKQPDGIIDYVYWSDGCYIHNGTAITNYDVAYQGDNWAKEVNTHEVIGNIYENPELLED